MSVPENIVAEFVDAAVQDADKAERLLSQFPGLRQSCWLGRDEPVLEFLVIENHYGGVEFCLEHGFKADCTRDGLGTTPLHYACHLGYTDIAELLLRHGAAPDANSEVYGTPYDISAAEGNRTLADRIQQLIDRPR